MFRSSNVKSSGVARIVVMRHAEAVWNAPRKRLQGQSPNPESNDKNAGNDCFKYILSNISSLYFALPEEACSRYLV